MLRFEKVSVLGSLRLVPVVFWVAQFFGAARKLECRDDRAMVGNPWTAVHNFANSIVFAHDGCIQHAEVNAGEVDAINTVEHLMVVRLASRKPIRI